MVIICHRQHRLVSADNGTTNIVNTYDYKHRRVRKNDTTYLYDGWNLISETVNGNDVRHYFWGLDLSDSMQGAGGVGGLLAVSQGGSMYYPVYDNNGNITAYLEDARSIVAAYDYNAFGETISQSGSMANGFAFRFSTKYHDNETGLYYYGYRFYDPVLCTWLNRDPIEEEGGLNLYGFCGNDGLNGSDNLGLVIRVNKKIETDYEYPPGGVRGSVRPIWIEPVSVTCENKKLKVSGLYEIQLSLLTASHELWNKRYARYDKKWGTRRTNAEERKAVYEHEMDHFKTYEKYEKYLADFNKMEGGCCSDARIREVTLQLCRLENSARAHSRVFDTDSYNYGGAYDSNPFIWR